jgi:hypothetical protein
MGRVRPVSGGGNHNFDTVQKQAPRFLTVLGKIFSTRFQTTKVDIGPALLT